MNKNTNAIPLAMATTSSILYTICVVLTSVNTGKDIMLKYLNVTMHGINITEIWAPNITLIGFIFGVVATFITWYVAGWIFTTMLEIFRK